MLIPYYHSGELDQDFVWVGISPNPEAHYGGNDYWVNNGGKLQTELNTILESGNQVIYTWQRTVSETPDGQAGYAVYTDCKLGDDVSSEDVYKAFEDAINDGSNNPNSQFYSLVIDGINDAKVENGKIIIGVNFISEQILSDNEEDIVKNKDTWVFEKPENSNGPAWTLVST